MSRRLLYVVLIALFLSGCAITTAKLSVDLPEVVKTESAVGKVFIGEIKDLRLEVANSNIIGVKIGAGGGHIIKAPEFTVHNYGGPIRGAHIQLENFDSFAHYLKKNLEIDFISKGYDIVDAPGPDVMVVDAQIQTCWVSAKRGMKMLLFSKVKVELSFNMNGDKQVHEISSGYSKSYHAATDARYKEIFLESMRQFNEKCKSRISALAKN